MQNQLRGRAEILIQQKKYAEAERVLNEMLSIDPGDVYILTLMAEVCLHQNKTEKAESLIDSALAISPDSGHLFYIKARIFIQKDQFDEAETWIQLALERDPEDSDFYAIWASVKLTRKQFLNAINLSNKALELDSENLLALNVRSTALLKLNNKEDSFHTIEGALREDPNNAFTHANYGWNLLENRDHKKALEHFREALKNDPTMEYAQAGMVEALKANNILYKLFLRYSFWIGNLTAKYQWGVIIGFYLGFRGLNYLASTNEALQPFLTPLLVLLALIAFSTWIITPVSNLFLRVSPFGRHLLTKKEIMSSNFVGASFIVFLIGIALYFIAGEEQALSIAVFGFAMMLPYSVMFNSSKYKNSLLIYAAVMTLIGVGAIWSAFTTGVLYNSYASIFLVGFIAFQWVANFLMIREGNA